MVRSDGEQAAPGAQDQSAASVPSRLPMAAQRVMVNTPPAAPALTLITSESGFVPASAPVFSGSNGSALVSYQALYLQVGHSSHQWV